MIGLHPAQTALEIEIGCGKGKFLLARAAQCPESRFVGVDYARKWLARGRKWGEKKALQNVTFVRMETREFLLEVAPESADIFHIYFPDPWPKRRHHKRRLVSEDFLVLLYGRLKPGGLIEIATDHAEYFEQIRRAAERTRPFWQSVRESRNRRLAFEDLKTSYELKYEAAARDLYYLELRKA